MSKAKKTKVRTPRPIARAAWDQPGAGAHVDRKKEERKTSCRKWRDTDN